MAKNEPGWELYLSFLTVLRTGSLSAAARALGLTQPTVGRHIGLLQDALGGRVLFTRSQSGLLPTQSAHELRPHAETMAAAAAALLRTAANEAGETAGVVRVAASDVIGVEVLPPILSEFRQRYPATAIELTLSNQMADLLRRDADIAVRMARPTQKALLAKRAGRAALGFYAHRRIVESYGEPRNLEDLIRFPLIGFDRVLPFAGAVKVLPMSVTRELFSFRTDNDVAQIAAIRAGVGIGLCQHGIGRRDPDLIPLLAKQFKIDLDLWIVMHSDLKRSPRMRLMFDHLALHFSNYAKESQPPR